jgi:BirA family biotin operon repressor/biotin-[acetyl-CoA-carboxylase] ligase
LSTIIFIDEADSTNSYATNLLKHYKPEEGTVIITANQTSGKGMMGNQWVFEPHKSFAGSWIFYPDFLEFNSAFYLYIISSLAVYDFLSEKIGNNSNELKIKWPNDIILKNKKICGILIENVFEKSKIKSSVIGIGINVGCSEKFKEFASLNRTEPMNNTDLKMFALDLDRKLNSYYDILKNKKKKELEKIYHERLKDFNANFLFYDLTACELVNGINKGIDEIGRLKVRVGNNLKHYASKEIKFI